MNWEYKKHQQDILKLCNYICRETKPNGNSMEKEGLKVNAGKIEIMVSH